LLLRCVTEVVGGGGGVGGGWSTSRCRIGRVGRARWTPPAVRGDPAAAARGDSSGVATVVSVGGPTRCVVRRSTDLAPTSRRSTAAAGSAAAVDVVGSTSTDVDRRVSV